MGLGGDGVGGAGIGAQAGVDELALRIESLPVGLHPDARRTPRMARLRPREGRL